MEERIRVEETLRLARTLEVIKKRIAASDSEVKKQWEFIIGYKEGLRGTHFIKQAMMSLYATDAYKMQQIMSNPYFGRFDFTTGEKTNKVYVGKLALMDGPEVVIYDWRSPICNLYYENGIGPQSYNSGNGIISGTVDLKRRIMIEDGNLIDATDTDVLSNDDFLLPYLQVNADKRLKSIVASIQSEQNRIIREPIDKNIIVQGVAGSGKTTVALHRVAYLLYRYNSKIKSDQFMIIGPNRFFLDYISAILPDLDVNLVEQNTFTEIVNTVLKQKIKIEDQTISLENLFKGKLNESSAKFKTSLLYKDLLDAYLTDYFKSMVSEDFVFEGITLSKKEFVTDKLGPEGDRIAPKLENFAKVIIERIKNSEDDIRHRIWQKYRAELLLLPQDDPRRKEINEYLSDVSKKLKDGCAKEVKNYLSLNNLNPVRIYKGFINSLSSIDGIDIESFKKESMQYLNKGIVRHEDLAAILYIGCRLFGAQNYSKFQHIVIDEAQDMGLFNFYVLKKLFPTATFSIFGDLNQSIYSFRSVDGWNDVANDVFNSKCELLELNKSYRTTKEIVDTANLVLDSVGCSQAMSVLRHGESVTIDECDKKHLPESILDIIGDFKEKGYKSIAIITKDESEAAKTYNELAAQGIELSKITYENDKYVGGTCVLPGYLSKGLEFDAVIINDCSDKKYNPDSTVDMELLYVSMTRPLHELVILYDGNITRPLGKLLQPDSQNPVAIKRKAYKSHLNQ